MTDLFERARDREEEIRQDAMRDQNRRAGLIGKTVDDSAHLCQMCGDRIPQARRETLPGVQTCIDCQREIERQGVSDWGMAE